MMETHRETKANSFMPGLFGSVALVGMVPMDRGKTFARVAVISSVAPAKKKSRNRRNTK